MATEDYPTICTVYIIFVMDIASVLLIMCRKYNRHVQHDNCNQPVDHGMTFYQSFRPIGFLKFKKCSEIAVCSV